VVGIDDEAEKTSGTLMLCPGLANVYALAEEAEVGVGGGLLSVVRMALLILMFGLELLAARPAGKFSKKEEETEKRDEDDLVPVVEKLFMELIESVETVEMVEISTFSECSEAAAAEVDATGTALFLGANGDTRGGAGTESKSDCSFSLV